MSTTVDLAALAWAIRQVQGEIRWKPGKAYRHLNKRKDLGHLPPQATLEEYERIIQTIVRHPQAFVYVFRYGDTDYLTIVAPYEEQEWLVMVGPQGVMETAFPPDEPDRYFGDDPRYIPVGTLEELLK